MQIAPDVLNKTDDLRSRLLLIKPRGFDLDELVVAALDETKGHFRRTMPQDPDRQEDDHDHGDGHGDTHVTVGSAAPRDVRSDGRKVDVTEVLTDFIRTEGIGTHVLKLTTALNKTSMDDMQRELLASVGVYDHILLKLLKVEGGKADDTDGLKLAVLTEVDDAPRDFFIKELTERFLKAEKLHLDDDDLQESFLRAVKHANMPLAKGHARPALARLFEEVNEEGNLPKFVRRYANERALINKTRFTKPVQAAMVDYLESIGLERIKVENFEKGAYDEYFAQAYHQALFGSGAKTTALVSVKPSAFDFDLDEFDLAEEQGVVIEHILAAAALYYMYVLGDLLGMFEIPNALMLRRARGQLYLKRGNAAARLQEHKTYVRTRAMEPADRMLLYKRVFDEGDVELLPDTVVNEEFPPLLHTLMNEVTKYISKSEANSSERDDKVSRAPIYEAIRNLQYNLSSYAADIAEDVLDLKEYFDRTKAILSDSDVIAAVVRGTRQDIWSVVETILREDLHRGINLRALRTLGIEGYKVFQFIANFDLSTPEDEFQQFMRSAEAWIIAQATLGDPAAVEDEEDEDFGDDSESDSASEEDDWES
jgi:hypothetical protein